MTAFRRFAAVIAVLAALLVPLSVLGQSGGGAAGLTGIPGIPFGGRVLTSIPCLTAPGFFEVSVLQPPLQIPHTYILSFTSPFLSHVPPHTGQSVVGRTTGGIYSCLVGFNFHIIAPISVFYGSSL